MPRGGKRLGAGRPTSAAREEAAERAAHKLVAELADADPHTALRRLLGWHDREFTACATKLPTATRTNRFLIVKQMQDHSVAIRLIVEQMGKLPAPSAEDARQCVIRAPQIEPDAETWRAKYARPEPDRASRKAVEDPETERLAQFLDAATEPPPKPWLVVDNDPQPPARTETLERGPHLTGLGPHEFGCLGPAQIADLKRRGRL
jgi:hypothetical protein